MHRREFCRLFAGAAFAGSLTHARASDTAWRAGAASVDITPAGSLWMAGFARRKSPAQGTALPLYAKALALQAGRERPAVLVTVDLLGLTARITDGVAAEVRRRRNLRRAELLFNASHTHCGPVVDEQLSVAYDLTPAQWDAIRAYSSELQAKLVSVTLDALAALQPARLGYARGRAEFGANRRVSFTPDGPVDHSVPVLRVDRPDGSPAAIVFGYACHNTTLQDSFVQYHGDYAGVAQAVLQRRHPSATALFVAGCGADVNPRPRGTVEHVEAHGQALAEAVDRVLDQAAPLRAALATRYGTVDLPFARGEARERWRRGLQIEEVYLHRHEALMQAALAREGRLPTSQKAPIQVWQFGRDLTLFAIGGEVVVDYALRLAREYPDRPVWAAGYSNDVFGYLPSLRVLREGGYEGGDAMIYYGRPAPFTADVEELVVGKIEQLVRR